MPAPDACDPRLRAVGILAPCLFPIPCTTLFLSLPVHGLDLPPLLHRFAAKLQTFAAISMSIWRQIAPVPARRLRRSRTAPTPSPHGVSAVHARHPHRPRTTPLRLSRRRNNLSLPRKGDDPRLTSLESRCLSPQLFMMALTFSFAMRRAFAAPSPRAQRPQSQRQTTSAA